MLENLNSPIKEADENDEESSEHNIFNSV